MLRQYFLCMTFNFTVHNVRGDDPDSGNASRDHAFSMSAAMPKQMVLLLLLRILNLPFNSNQHS